MEREPVKRGRTRRERMYVLGVTGLFVFLMTLFALLSDIYTGNTRAQAPDKTEFRTQTERDSYARNGRKQIEKQHKEVFSDKIQVSEKAFFVVWQNRRCEK